MAKNLTKIFLQKAIKEGLRRCVYRRYEAEVKGNTFVTTLTKLERMYRGNTPYPTGISTKTQKALRSRSDADVAMVEWIKRKRLQGYRRCTAILKTYR